MHTREELLGLWEHHHGTMSDVHRQSFLTRPELDELAALPQAVLESAFSASRRLVEIAKVAAADPRAGGAEEGRDAVAEPATRSAGERPVDSPGRENPDPDGSDPSAASAPVVASVAHGGTCERCGERLVVGARWQYDIADEVAQGRRDAEGFLRDLPRPYPYSSAPSAEARYVVTVAQQGGVTYCAKCVWSEISERAEGAWCAKCICGKHINPIDGCSSENAPWHRDKYGPPVGAIEREWQLENSERAAAIERDDLAEHLWPERDPETGYLREDD